MIPLSLEGKVALITGVGDNMSFAWHISRAMQAAGARLVFASHPRMVNIVSNLLESDKPAAALVEYATMNEVEHLLIGAPGSGAPRRFGGVCAQVVASAPCTVTVVRPRAKG